MYHSNAHYVGYVEDEESVEAIMKKFEELERIQQEFSTLNMQPPTSSEEAGGSSSKAMESEDNKENIQHEDEEMSEFMSDIKPQMTQEQLEEVFKRTSAFTVKSASLDTDSIEDLDALDLWQVEQQDSSTTEFYEEE